MPINTAKTNWFRRLALGATSMALLGIGFAPTTSADEYNKKTIVTTNTPIEVPGKVLPPGTYVFKLLDSQGNRNIVQIFDKDEKHLYATILAIPDYRLQPADKPLLRFEERPSNTPEAVKAWFYPGDQYGQEFVYPHKRATEIARQSGQDVLSMRDEMTQNTNTQAKSANSPDIQSLEKTQVTGVNPAGQEIELDVVIQPQPPK